MSEFYKGPSYHSHDDGETLIEGDFCDECVPAVFDDGPKYTVTEINRRTGVVTIDFDAPYGGKK